MKVFTHLEWRSKLFYRYGGLLKLLLPLLLLVFLSIPNPFTCFEELSREHDLKSGKAAVQLDMFAIGKRSYRKSLVQQDRVSFDLFGLSLSRTTDALPLDVQRILAEWKVGVKDERGPPRAC